LLTESGSYWFVLSVPREENEENGEQEFHVAPSGWAFSLNPQTHQLQEMRLVFVDRDLMGTTFAVLTGPSYRGTKRPGRSATSTSTDHA
jgi:hypothetical protein